VDRLLCSWAFERADVSDELSEALQVVPLSATPVEAVELAKGAAARAARRVHPLIGLQKRLNGYLHVLREELDIELEVDPEGDTLTLEDGDVPIYVCLQPGTQQRPRPGTQQRPRSVASPHRLRSVVRSWDRFKRGSTIRLDSVGPLLTNAVTDTSATGRRAQAVEEGPLDHSSFERKLDAELGRGRRQSTRVSLALLHCLATEGDPDQELDAAVLGEVEELVRSSLRVYDIVEQARDQEFRLILPGASHNDCAAVIARIRQRLAASKEPLQLCVGTATSPGEGTTGADLLTRAARAREQDRQRLLSGEVEIDSIPASMVERFARQQEHPSTIWLGGVPLRMPVRVLRSDRGIRLKLPLSFLRRGTSFRIDLDHGKHCSGVLQGAVLGRYRAADQTPVVYLEVQTE
jgi:GGDEF domain-containing protein